MIACSNDTRYSADYINSIKFEDYPEEGQELLKEAIKINYSF